MKQKKDWNKLKLRKKRFNALLDQNAQNEMLSSVWSGEKSFNS